MTKSESKNTIANPVLVSHSTGAVSEEFSNDSLSLSVTNTLSEHEISNKAFEAIIKRYVLELPNVVRFTSTSLRGSFAEIVGHKTEESSILIQKNNDHTINVSLALVVTFDSFIPTLMNEVEAIIREKIEEYTSIHVHKVRIYIQDIVAKDSAIEESEEE